MINDKIRLIVNAIPLANVNTGIGRYLQCLYGCLEELYSDRLEVGYFDGNTVLRHPPRGPSDLNRWSRQVDLFWRLPALPALCIRILMHYRREILFRKAAEGYDLYHEPGFFPFDFPSSLKTIFTLYDLSLIRFPQFHPQERVLFFRLFFEKRCRNVDSFLSISEFTRKEMQDVLGIKEDRVMVTPLAHNPQIFYPRSIPEVNDARKRLGLPNNYFLFVGSGDPRKNIHVIPKALAQTGLGIPLVVAGWSGWDEKQSRDEVIYPGYVQDEDLARLYSGALALVYPSLYEGFGLPVLEAMACGCPVICSRMASLPEVAGDAALYLEDPTNPDELAGLLREVASREELRRSLAQRGQVQASLFSWEKTARRTFEVFQQIT